MNKQTFCPKGHAYDSSLPACPYCLPGQGGVGPTAPANNQYGSANQGGGYQSGVGPTAPANNQYGSANQGGVYQSGVGSTAPANNQYGSANQGGGYQSSVGPTAPVQQKTVFIGDLADPNNPSATQQSQLNRVRPVVGWLVCVEGPDIGKDFRLHTHFNHVGQAEWQDVRLSDPTVSREHFTVSYDLVNNRYFADMNKGSTFVYINNNPLGGRVVLKRGDQIKVGKTLLVFIPLEQQDVQWNWRT